MTDLISRNKISSAIPFRMQIFGQDDNALQILSNRRSLHNIEPETNGDTKQNVNGFDEEMRRETDC